MDEYETEDFVFLSDFYNWLDENDDKVIDFDCISITYKF